MEKIHRGNGFYIVETEEKIVMSFMTGSLVDRTVSYEISRENMIKALKSDKDAREVMHFVAFGRWPLTEEEELEEDKNFMRRCPDLLIKIPKNQEIFKDDPEELKILLERGQKMIDEGLD